MLSNGNQAKGCSSHNRLDPRPVNVTAPLFSFLDPEVNNFSHSKISISFQDSLEDHTQPSSRTHLKAPMLGSGIFIYIIPFCSNKIYVCHICKGKAEDKAKSYHPDEL